MKFIKIRKHFYRNSKLKLYTKHPPSVLSQFRPKLYHIGNEWIFVIGYTGIRSGRYGTVCGYTVYDGSCHVHMRINQTYIYTWSIRTKTDCQWYARINWPARYVSPEKCIKRIQIQIFGVFCVSAMCTDSEILQTQSDKNVRRFMFYFWFKSISFCRGMTPFCVIVPEKYV